MTEQSIEHMRSIVAEKGTDAWYQLPVEDLLPPDMRDQAPRLKKGEDTMVQPLLVPCLSRRIARGNAIDRLQLPREVLSTWALHCGPAR